MMPIQRGQASKAKRRSERKAYPDIGFNYLLLNLYLLDLKLCDSINSFFFLLKLLYVDFLSLAMKVLPNTRAKQNFCH